MRRAILFAGGLFLSAALPDVSPAQNPRANDEFWVVSYYEVEWPKMDSLTKLFKAYTLPAAAEAKKAGVLLDYRILVHRWAGRENLIIMQKYANFAAIAGDTSMTGALNRLLSDPTKRKAVQDAFASLSGGSIHRDEIFSEIKQ